jgi:hypothetical protein
VLLLDWHYEEKKPQKRKKRLKIAKLQKQGDERMEININLLPKPKKKGYDFIIISIFTLALFFASYQGLALYQGTTQQIDELQKEMDKNDDLKTRTLQEIMKHQSEITAVNYVEHYSRLHTFLTDLYLEPSDLLKELGNQLPTYGKIDSLSIDYGGRAHIEGTFRTMGDVAAFSQHLLESPYILDVHVEAITTESINESNTRYYASFQLSFQTLGGDLDD